MNLKRKEKTCKECKSKFLPFNTTQVVCSPKCAISYGKKKQKKEWSTRKKKIKEGLMTHKDYLKIAQVAFNTYIRHRDKNKQCISCTTQLRGKFDAGHFYSVGSSPELRFHEDNVWGQCVHCNQHLHGNLLAYRERLINRIGLERFNELESLKGGSNKLSIEELKELINKYRSLVKGK